MVMLIGPGRLTSLAAALLEQAGGVERCLLVFTRLTHLLIDRPEHSIHEFTG